MADATFPGVLEIGQVLRDSRDRRPAIVDIDGFRNFWAATHSPHSAAVPFSKGINSIKAVVGPDGPRIPAILIASSPHKRGSISTPWQDFFDPDNGYVRYHGDCKEPGVDPSQTDGNRTLLSARDVQHDPNPAVRRHSAPLIFFERVPQAGRVKGFVRFQGFGIVLRAERVSELNQATGRSFANYSFDCVVLGLEAENEQFDWDWITRRRDASQALSDTESVAPAAWRRWLRLGPAAAGQVRRRVSKLDIESEASQRQLDPARRKTLDTIYSFYEGRKQRFELLAYHVTVRVVGTVPRLGGVTQGSADWGIDFIARLDVGTGSHFGRAKLVVLGQAKCEDPTGTTNAKDIARTVARLRRGWLGVYVTTAAITRRAQREVIEDRYPIVLINGARLADEVLQMAHEAGVSVMTLLKTIDAEFPEHIPPRDPEELLRE